MKVIDLLNKIAKGEEVPKKIKWNGDMWNYSNSASKNYFNDYEDLFSVIDGSNLNEEVEIIEEEQEDNFSGIKYFADGRCYMSIESEPPKTKDIEEDKEIEKIIINEEYLFSNMKESTYLSQEERRLLDSNYKELSYVINELIDEVNKLKRGDE